MRERELDGRIKDLKIEIKLKREFEYRKGGEREVEKDK